MKYTGNFVMPAQTKQNTEVNTNAIGTRGSDGGKSYKKNTK